MRCAAASTMPYIPVAFIFRSMINAVFLFVYNCFSALSAYKQTLKDIIGIGFVKMLLNADTLLYRFKILSADKRLMCIRNGYPLAFRSYNNALILK